MKSVAAPTGQQDIHLCDQSHKEGTTSPLAARASPSKIELCHLSSHLGRVVDNAVSHRWLVAIECDKFFRKKLDEKDRAGEVSMACALSDDMLYLPSMMDHHSYILNRRFISRTCVSSHHHHGTYLIANCLRGNVVFSDTPSPGFQDPHMRQNVSTFSRQDGSPANSRPTQGGSKSDAKIGKSGGLNITTA